MNTQLSTYSGSGALHRVSLGQLEPTRIFLFEYSGHFWYAVIARVETQNLPDSN